MRTLDKIMSKQISPEYRVKGRKILSEYSFATEYQHCQELNDVACIYAIENTLTKQRYIGKTKNAKKRMQSHKAAMINGLHRNHGIRHDVKKFGEGVFVFKPLAVFYSDGWGGWHNRGFSFLEKSFIAATAHRYNINSVCTLLNKTNPI